MSNVNNSARASGKDWWKWLLPLLTLAAILGYFLFRNPVSLNRRMPSSYGSSNQVQEQIC